MTARKDISIIMIAVITANTPAAPRPSLKCFPTITNPFASAKSAIDHIKNQANATILNT